MPNDHRPNARASGRVGQLGALLAGALASLERTHGDAAVSVLDCGGGSGSLAVPLAAAGATVTVVDISVDALATLRRRAVEAGVADRIIPVQGDVEKLGDTVPAAAFELVLAHGILEVVEALPATFGAIVATVHSGGLLSILVGNPVAAVLGRALVGDLAGAERELATLDSDEHRLGPVAVQQLCAEHGLVVEQVHGIGVFRELVPGNALDLPETRDAIDRLDDACAQRRPFAELAARVHVLARRGAADGT